VANVDSYSIEIPELIRKEIVAVGSSTEASLFQGNYVKYNIL